MPGWMFRYIEGIVHQRELNSLIRDLEHYRGFDFVSKALEFLDISIDIRGVDRIPLSGRITLCANHPTGGADGLAMFLLAARLGRGVLVPVNDLLFSIQQLEEFFVAVDKHGSNFQRIKDLDAMYASEKPVVIFPAGRTSRPGMDGLREFPWVGSFVRKSREHGRWIIPVHIGGRNSRFFYALWRTRNLLRIRTNLEMFFLVDELFKKRGTSIRLTVGEALPHGIFDSSRRDIGWADSLRSYVDRLGEDEQSKFFPGGRNVPTH